MRRMRIPFAFMGFLCMLLGMSFFAWFIIRGPDGPVSGGIEVAMAFTMVAFGSWVVWRRFTGGDQA